MEIKSLAGKITYFTALILCYVPYFFIVRDENSTLSSGIYILASLALIILTIIGFKADGLKSMPIAIFLFQNKLTVYNIGFIAPIYFPLSKLGNTTISIESKVYLISLSLFILCLLKSKIEGKNRR